jgi:sulfur-oxidizing protein SoxX
MTERSVARGGSVGRALSGFAVMFGVLAPACAQPQMPGQDLVLDRTKGNCLACHTMQDSDVPSNVGPELSRIKARFPGRKVLYDIIFDEPARNPQTPMPPFGRNLILSDREIEEIIDFLYTR